MFILPSFPFLPAVAGTRYSVPSFPFRECRRVSFKGRENICPQAPNALRTECHANPKGPNTFRVGGVVTPEDEVRAQLIFAG